MSFQLFGTFLFFLITISKVFIVFYLILLMSLLQGVLTIFLIKHTGVIFHWILPLSREAIDFYVFFFYLVTLLNFLTSFNSGSVLDFISKLPYHLPIMAVIPLLF
jgi:hypothetical protein